MSARDDAYTLALWCLQFPGYDTDAAFRELTDRVLAHTRVSDSLVKRP